MPFALALAALAALAATAPAARAAVPAANAKFEAHDHTTRGANWHVEAEISSTSKSVRSLVLFVEECKRTVLAKNVALALPDGSLVAGGELPATKNAGPGAWRLQARFVEAGHIEGTYEMTAPDCATGVRVFDAHVGGHGPSSGTPVGAFPDFSKVTAARRREARRLWHHTADAASTQFPAYADARRNQFLRVPKARTRPLIFHVRRKGYENDDHVLDFRRPESLVYWWPIQGPPVLLAFMYRAPIDTTPVFGSPLLGWHSHVTAYGKLGRSQMTHVWLTGDLRSAYANCLPVQALEQAIPEFRFSAPGEPLTHASLPCPPA